VKQTVFTTLNLIISLALGFFIWTQLPLYLQEGGPLVGILIALLIMLIAFIIERVLSLNKAKGKGSPQSFFKKIVMLIQSDDYDGALATCDKQRGSLANVLRAGIQHYKSVKDGDLDSEKRLEESQRAIEEANALEVPLLERNLIALSTIASIGHRSCLRRCYRRHRAGYRYFRGAGQYRGRSDIRYRRYCRL